MTRSSKPATASTRRRAFACSWLRGAGEAFAAGTDIAQFQGFDGPAGVAYQRRLDAVVDRLERVRRATIAQIPVTARRHRRRTGGLRLRATSHGSAQSARLGMPIARTLGNCLSIANVARGVDLIGTARVRGTAHHGPAGSTPRRLRPAASSPASSPIPRSTTTCARPPTTCRFSRSADDRHHQGHAHPAARVPAPARRGGSRRVLLRQRRLP